MGVRCVEGEIVAVCPAVSFRDNGLRARYSGWIDPRAQRHAPAGRDIEPARQVHGDILARAIERDGCAVRIARPPRRGVVRRRHAQSRRVAEPLITLGKEPTLANKRLAFNRMRDRDMVLKLFAELGPRYKERKGGYLRILKFGFRNGDNAPMALVELVDRPEPSESPATETTGE